VWQTLHENSANNYHSLLTDDVKQDHLRQLLKAQYDHLVTYAESHHIHMPPSITRRGASGQDPSSTTKPGTGAEGGAEGQEATYEEKFAMVQEYLLEMIKIEDYDNSGVLDDNDLWLILTDMELGYTEEELAAFSGWYVSTMFVLVLFSPHLTSPHLNVNICCCFLCFCRIDVDSDGQIDYNEILRELTDDVVQVIEDVGHISVSEKLADLRQQRENKFKKLNISLNEGGHAAAAASSSSAPPLPPSLMDYLKDTFNEVDTDHSGTLNIHELNNILHTVLANSEGDKELLSIDWDKDNDGAVSWDEASKAFAEIFDKYINSKNDYWVRH
jgi:Ca2+-binding EF-hand superfamily protein